tara:strand:- start:499 stop:1047 length:549 start_codon:yes stop_codon:yes gene_type:complete
LGDAGLSIDDSRNIVRLSTTPGVGDKPPSLVVGPMDKTKSAAAVDALLKTIEEIGSKPLRLVLWADDLAGVIPTIRSRTQVVWCPAGPNWLDPLSYKEDEAKVLCAAVLTQDPSRILGALDGQDKEWPDLASALCVELAKVDPEDWGTVLKVWEPLRRTLRGKGGPIVLVDALLPPTALEAM